MPVQKRPQRLELTDWDRLRVVLAVQRGGTLSAAAKALRVDHTTVGRRLAALERDLNSTLFERGPSGLSPTPLGEEVLASAELVENEIDGLLRRVDGAATGLAGRVRLTTTPHLAASIIAPALDKLIGSHPKLEIELIGDNRALDLSRREADVAVRLSRPTVPGLVTRELGQMAFGFYVSTSDRRPFKEQRFLGYEDISGSTTLERHLASLVSIDRVVLRSNAMQVLIEAARAGLGAALMPCFVADGDTALRPLAAPCMFPNLSLWLIYHEDVRRSPRVRALSTFLVEVFKARQSLLVPANRPA